MLRIESTYKAKDVEETLDIYFYRPVGYIFALACKNMGIKPNTVTFTGMLLGVLAGHLFYYSNSTLTTVGILLLIISEGLDSADGQLARMTNYRSRTGRIFDGFASNIIFVSIYIHLCLRIINEGAGLWIFAIALASGLSHSLQSAIADYYRNGYLYFVISPEKGELDNSENIKQKYYKLSWSKNFIEKFFMRVYLNYTVEQEALSGRLIILKNITRRVFGGTLPPDFGSQYKQFNKPLLKYHNMLTTNTRMLFLFFVLLIDNVRLYFSFELIILNAILLYVVIKEEKINAILINSVLKLEKEPTNA